MLRVTVFENGNSTVGKVLLVPNTIEEFILQVSQKFNSSVKYFYNTYGGVIEDVLTIRDNDVLFFSNGEPFVIPPERLKKESVKNEWISLNVGGKIFTTTKSTLVTKDPDSMLAKMFGGMDGYGSFCPSVQDSSSAYLIDRSYVYFEPILNYLRTGMLIIDPNVNPQGVLEEAKFYALESVIEELEPQIQKSCISKPFGEPLSRSDVVAALLTTEPKQELRFQSVDLSGANLSKLDLRNINFKYADFTDSDLSGANLSGCNLERAVLVRANLEGAQLLNVKLLCAHMPGANLKSCNFEDPSGSRANCEGVNLSGAVLDGSMMAGINLRVAKLKNCKMRGCDLRAAVLAGADLEDSDLTGSDLQEANLRGANLEGVAFDLMQTPLHMSQTCGL